MARGKIAAGRPLAVKAALAALLFLALQGVAGGCGGKRGVEAVGEGSMTQSGSRGGKAGVEASGGGGTVRAGVLREMSRAAEKSLYGAFMPCILFEGSGGHETFWLLQRQIESLFPLYGYIAGSLGEDEGERVTLREILLAEAQERLVENEQLGSILPQEETQPGDAPQEEGAEADRTPGEPAEAENQAAVRAKAGKNFVPHSFQEEVDLESLRDYETLLKLFFIVDANTSVGSDRLNVDSLLGRDMRISRERNGPQILIYHTHSGEAFADSVPGDASTAIVGAGERLAQILTDTYGYSVLHHTAQYDADRNRAYSKAMPEIEELLRENPSIQVVIDLHRDQMPEETKLVMDLDGRPTARFMFFNGLSRTKKTGDIAYLYNENLDANLAFSFQMQKKAAEYYPGLTRKIYLKGYRYNMHLKDKYLLVELGAQNNTVEEVMNACDPLAHILDMVLSGEGEEAD